MEIEILSSIIICLCAVLFMSWMNDVNRRFYALSYMVLATVFVITVCYPNVQPFLYIALSTIIQYSKQHGLLQSIQIACSSIFLVMVVSLFFHSLYTIFITDFQEKTYKDTLICVSLLLTTILAVTILKKANIQAPMGNLGWLMAGIEGFLLIFYSFVPLLLGVRDYVLTAWLNLIVMSVVFCLIVLFAHVHSLQVRNLRLRHDSETKAEINRLLETFTVMRHAQSTYYKELKPMIDAKQWDDLRQYFYKYIVPQHQQFNRHDPLLKKIHCEHLRCLLYIAIANINDTCPGSLNFSVVGEVTIPEHLARPIHDIVSIFIDNAEIYVRQYGGSLSIQLYGEPGYCSIEIVNTVHPDFDENILSIPNKKSPAKSGNGLYIAHQILEQFPQELLHYPLVRKEHGLPFELSQQVIIIEKGSGSHAGSIEKD